MCRVQGQRTVAEHVRQLSGRSGGGGAVVQHLTQRRQPRQRPAGGAAGNAQP